MNKNCIYYIVETYVANLSDPKPYKHIMGYLDSYREADEKVKELETKYPKYKASDGKEYPIFEIEMVQPFFDDDDETNDLKNEDSNTISEDYNVYGSKLSDIDEINRLKLENSILKQVVGDLELEIYKLRNK